MPLAVHRIPLRNFLQMDGRGRFPVARAERFPSGMFDGVLEAVRRAAPSLAGSRRSAGVPGFSLAAGRTGAGPGVVCAWEESSGRVAGGLAREAPYVLPEFRGRRLGREILLAAFEAGLKDPFAPQLFSPAGHAAMRSVHRLAVERALARGESVPGGVLAAYPDLAAT